MQRAAKQGLSVHLRWSESRWLWAVNVLEFRAWPKGCGAEHRQTSAQRQNKRPCSLCSVCKKSVKHETLKGEDARFSILRATCSFRLERLLATPGPPSRGQKAAEQSTDRLLLSGKTSGLARFVVCARSL